MSIYFGGNGSGVGVRMFSTSGSQGSQGAQGAQGDSGSQGLQGSQGSQGLQGAQGAQGDSGSQGLQGSQGSQGLQGLQGTQGEQGIITGSVVLSSDAVYDLGSPSNRFNQVYAVQMSATTGSFSGDVNISGNLNVLGTQTVVNSTAVSIGDNIVQLNSTATPQQYGGLYIADTTANTTGSLLWDSNANRWVAGFKDTEIGLVSGSGASNYVTKWSGSNGVTSGSIYDTGTNVGIGTTSPSTLAATRSFVIGQNVVTEQNAIKVFGGVNADKAPVISIFRSGNSEGIISQLTGSNALALGSGGGIASFTDAALTAYSAMFIRNTGNVSIGAATPSSTSKFYVSGSSTASTATAIIREGVASPTGGVGALDVQNSAGTSLLFVSGSGNVGIGTTTPADSSGWSGKLLDIRGNTDSNGAVVYFSALSGANYRAYVGSVPTYGLILGSKTALPITMWTNDTERVRVTSTGNVGIGTTTPSDKLDVAGILRISTSYTVATLPAAGTAGRITRVTDGASALAWGDTVSGGGSSNYLVWDNGSAWKVFGK